MKYSLTVILFIKDKSKVKSKNNAHVLFIILIFLEKIKTSIKNNRYNDFQPNFILILFSSSSSIVSKRKSVKYKKVIRIISFEIYLRSI